MHYVFIGFLALALLALVIGYVRLCRAMRAAAIQRPPYVHFLLVFAAYGALFGSLALISGTLFGFPEPVTIVFESAGVSLMWVAFFIAPILILISSCLVFKRRTDSKFHRTAFRSGLAYLGPVGTALVFLKLAMYLHQQTVRREWERAPHDCEAAPSRAVGALSCPGGTADISRG